ncbi:MAG TPA: NERD domain-containing protein [Candidatus Jeotgalibaca merdavium]|uniref:NERD domain-containing protein n=1 Tax=Candidatus Jeotgalibaca merdavium TaxID=2838627 RepID=A0A9D2I188_9LACT|nr:NERD domain-containing protein [Candidatus Jeotgalibaca merdavium]
MFMKARTESTALKVMKALSKRTSLSVLDKQYFFRQERGHQGEEKLDRYTQAISERYPVLNDLNLSVYTNDFQIDTLIIKGQTLHLYEVKHLTHDYIYENGKLRKLSNFRVANPTGQSDRAESNLSNFVRWQGYDYRIEEHIVFTHPAFFMYQAPVDSNYIFLPQLERHLEQTYPYEEVGDHASFISCLLSHHQADYRAHNLPHYDYDAIRKGICCPHCASFDGGHTRQLRICLTCGHKETAIQAIRRTAEEFELLFPAMAATPAQIHDWCGGIYSYRRIYGALRERNVD